MSNGHCLTNVAYEYPMDIVHIYNTFILYIDICKYGNKIYENSNRITDNQFTK